MNMTNAVRGILLALLALPSSMTAMSFPRPVPSIALDGKLSCPYVSTYGGTAYLQVSLSTSGVDRRPRRPMNIAVVLDRSGSMADAGKFEYAKEAVLAIVDRLTPGDLFSLVIYDDVIEVPLVAQHVDNRAVVRRLVEGIYPRGATNLGGGMTEGFRQVERNLGREMVNRVILISDGLANRGITDPGALDRIAGKYRQRSVSLTTMGVGLEYNENLMVDLSRAGGGNYYFIESPSTLASIMGRELNTLWCVVVQDASIELKLGRGVRVHDVIGCEHTEGGGTVVIPVGDLYAGECREFTVELLIPEGNGVLKAVTGELTYDSDVVPLNSSPSFTVFVHYTSDAAVMEKNRDWDTQAKADVALSTRAVERAMEMLDSGRPSEAGRALNAAQQSLVSSQAAARSVGGAVIIRDQASRLGEYAKILKDEKTDVRSKKKSIQFHNYETQRNK